MKITNRRCIPIALGTASLIAFAVALPATTQALPKDPSVLNGRIAFATEGIHSQLYSVNPDGTDQRQLTHVASGVDVDMPDWSPDGSQIAYTSDPSGSADIWLMNADGSDQRVLVHNDGWDYEQPKWSPDGTRFAAVRCSQQFEFCDLVVMDTDGSHRRIVIGSHVLNVDPSWSPDGTQIAFSSNRRGLVWAVWIVDLTSQTNRLRRLTKPGIEGCLPSWSPAGNRLLFMSNCETGNPHLYSMSPYGTHIRRLSPEPPDAAALAGSYSPDGRQIIFTTDVDRPVGLDLFTMTGAGKDATPIVTNHGAVFFSDWGTAPPTSDSDLVASSTAQRAQTPGGLR